MSKFKLNLKAKSAILVLGFLLRVISLHADSPCGSFIIKAKFYTQSGTIDSGFVFYKWFKDSSMVFNVITEYYEIHHRIDRQSIDFSLIPEFDTSKYGNILAVNSALLTHTDISPDSEGHYEMETIPVGDSIYELNLLDTVNYTHFSTGSDLGNYVRLDSSVNSFSDRIFYSKASYIDLDTISLITLDTILWCGDFSQLQFLESFEVNILSAGDFDAHFCVYDKNAEQFWIDFFTFDAEWTKSRVLSELDLMQLDEHFNKYGVDNIEAAFPQSLQEAIQEMKIICFGRYCP